VGRKVRTQKITKQNMKKITMFVSVLMAMILLGTSVKADVPGMFYRFFNGVAFSNNFDRLGIGGFPSAKLDVTDRAIISTPMFTGSGYDDLTIPAYVTYTGTATSAMTYTLIIDSSKWSGATTTVDTFEWKHNGGSYTTGVSITGAAQTLENGLQIKFATTQNHTLGDQWTFTVNPDNPFSLTNTAGTQVMKVDNAGATTITGATAIIGATTITGLTHITSATTTITGAADITGAVRLDAIGSASHTVCFKSDGITLGYCSANATSTTNGTCTCN
jgi:hypothetical protein